MNPRRCILGLLLLAFGQVAAAQTPAEIVDRAINVHGGATALTKMKAVEQSAKGRCNLGGPDLETVREGKWALPDRVLWSLDMTREGSRVKTLIGLNGLTGWHKNNANPALDLPPGLFDLIADESWVQWLCTVAPLTQKGLKLAADKSIPVDGQPADGVLVSKEGRPDVTLYFSKSSGLLVRAAARIKDGGGTANKEWTFALHKEFAGVRLPTKITEVQNGIRQAEWANVEYKFVEKFDPMIFRKP